MIITAKMMAENTEAVVAMIVDNFHELTIDDLNYLIDLEKTLEKRPEVIHTLERQITRKGFANEHPLEISLPHNYPIWQDFSNFFYRIFSEGDLNVLWVNGTAEQFTEDINDMFDAKHTIDEVRKLLDVSYAHPTNPGLYHIKREDFIRQGNADQEAAAV